MHEHFLGPNATDWAALQASGRVAIDFTQHFVGSGVLPGHIDPTKCIHGEGECVGQRHFSCAKANLSSHAGSGENTSFRLDGRWLDFQRCSYGICTDCAAIRGPHCPCSNYTTFTDFASNNIMKSCAAQVGLPWDQLHACGTGPEGQQLMEASSRVSNDDKVTYGLDGLAPIYVNGVKVKTRQLIPLVCGPTPKEITAALCAALRAQGASPTDLPASCGAGEGA